MAEKKCGPREFQIFEIDGYNIFQDRREKLWASEETQKFKNRLVGRGIRPPNFNFSRPAGNF